MLRKLVGVMKAAMSVKSYDQESAQTDIYTVLLCVQYALKVERGLEAKTVRAEAKMLRALQPSPHVVRLIEQGTASERSFMVMEVCLLPRLYGSHFIKGVAIYTDACTVRMAEVISGR